MTYIRFLILEWTGRWTIPDHLHGGIYAGPYSLLSVAKEAIALREREDKAGWLESGLSQGKAEEFAANYKSHHTIIEVSFPEDLVKGTEDE